MIARHLQRILTWSDTNVPGLRASMRPGASSASIRTIEDAIGAELPADVAELYRIHDGQTETHESNGLIYGFPLVPLEAALGYWAGWRDTLATAPDLQENEWQTSFPPETIQPHWMNRGWFPLTSDGMGNHLGIDLAPGPRGTRGQFITFGRNQDEKLLMAASLTDFFGWYASEIEGGNFIVELDHDEDEDGAPMPPVVTRFEMKTMSFYDACRARHGA